MPTYAFVLTAHGLALVGPHPDSPPLFQELEPGIFGPPLPDDPSRFELMDPMAFQKALVRLLDELGRSVKRAHLALDGGLLRHLHLPLSYVPERHELRTVVLTELERYAIFSGTDIAFDFALLRQEAESLTVLMAAFRFDSMRPILEAFATEGVTITSVEPAVMAMLRAWGGPKAEGPSGMIATGTHHLDVAAWQDGRPASWRRIYLGAFQLEDPGQLSETVTELQRTMIDVAAPTWQAINLPDPVLTSLQARLPAGFVREYPDALGEMAEGALQFGPDALPCALDLLPEAAAPKRALNNRQWLLLGVAAGILAVFLGASILLDSRARGLTTALDRIQSRTLELQTSLSERSGGAGQRAEAERLIAGTRLGAGLLRELQAATPDDTWIQEAKIQTGDKLQLTGYALSRTSPLTLARSLEAIAPAGAIALPVLEQGEADGARVFRFVIEAELAPKEAP